MSSYGSRGNSGYGNGYDRDRDSRGSQESGGGSGGGSGYGYGRGGGGGGGAGDRDRGGSYGGGSYGGGRSSGGGGSRGGGRGGGCGRDFGTSFSRGRSPECPDWKSVEKFERCLYSPPQSDRSKDEVAEFRAKHEMSIVKGGKSVPDPIFNFGEAGLPNNVANCLKESGFSVSQSSKTHWEIMKTTH
jgi:hypothetical protein